MATPKLSKTTKKVVTVDNTKKVDPDAQLLEKVKADYEQFTKYVNGYRTKWEKHWKLWNNQRVRRQYDGDSDSFDPMTFQMVETINDNVYGSRPKLTFLPNQKDQETDTKILVGLWERSWDESDMDETMPIFGREVSITGNGCLFPAWEDGYMCIKHFPLRDCIFDIGAVRPQDVTYAGYRRLDMLDNVKAATRFDPEAGEKDSDGKPQGAKVPRYKNLDRIQGVGGLGGELTDKQLKEAIYAGSTLTTDGQKNQVEIIMMMYTDRFVEIANRSTVIYEGPNPYHKDAYELTVQERNERGEGLYDETTLPEGAEFMDDEELAAALGQEQVTITVPAIEPFIPFVMHRGYVDPALLIAKGDVETFADTQEDVNDALNMKKDNVIYNVQNVAVIDELSKSAIPQLSQAKPGSIIPIKGLTAGGQNTFKWLEKPNFTQAADVELERAKKSIRDTARVAETAQGIDVTGGDRTATEINAQVAQSSGGFATKVRALEAGAYKQLGEMFIKMVQIFLTDEQLVRIIGKDGVEFANYDPEQFWGLYDVKVVLETTAKAQQKEDADLALETYKLFAGDPDVNQIELKKLVGRKALGMDDDDMELLFSPNPQQLPLGPDGQPAPDATAGSPTAQPGLPAGPQVAPAPQEPAQFV